MALPANGGQQLTPYQNVFALMRMGGDTWGANGGGADPVAGPLPVLANAARGVRDLTAVYDDKNNAVVKAGLSNGAVDVQTVDQAYADDSTQTVWTADLESPNVATSQL
jgi:hypothetical protein